MSATSGRACDACKLMFSEPPHAECPVCGQPTRQVSVEAAGPFRVREEPQWVESREGHERRDGRAKVVATGAHGRWVVFLRASSGSWRRVGGYYKDEDRAKARADARVKGE